MQIFLARACILLNFDTFFPISVAISPLSFSKLLCYHFNTTPLLSCTFPVLLQYPAICLPLDGIPFRVS